MAMAGRVSSPSSSSTSSSSSSSRAAFSSSSGSSSMSQGGTFFWEQKSKTRLRFNLLLLEFNEYLLEDVSVFYSTSLEKDSASRVQGRLKVCSRSLIFEPSDVKRPILKYPFKHCANFSLQSSSTSQGEQFLAFSATSFFELKAGGKVGPYKQCGKGESSSSSSSRVVAHEEDTAFAVFLSPVHSEVSLLLAKVVRLFDIFDASIELGSRQADALLQDFVREHYPPPIPLFDTSTLIDFHEKLLLPGPSHCLPVKRIKPLVSNIGILVLTDARVYFQPSSVNNIGDAMQVIDLSRVVKTYCRRFLLRQTGLEFILKDGSSTLFAFNSNAERDEFYSHLSPCLQQLTIPRIDAVTRRWQNREISNLDYLIFLNNEADRSINDLTQYPVFPHILCDYTSEELNLDDPSVYRDLSKPIGALNPTRLEYFRARFEAMPPQDESLGLPPPFLYGTHYSTPGYVLHYLVRVAPEFMLCLQNGKFDAPDRMFHSLPDMWESCLTNPTDLKELIPEFFTGNGEFLVNADDLDLGRRHTGDKLGDVVLPPWAKRPADFIRKMARALESDHVSAHLHEWIDLIFGYKQKGEQAKLHDNLYYHLTYEGAVDLEALSQRERAALEVQIQEFGQAPKQIFAERHPARGGAGSDNPVVLCVAGRVGGAGGAGAGVASAVPLKQRSTSTSSTGSTGSGGGGGSPIGRTGSKEGRTTLNLQQVEVRELGPEFKEEVQRVVQQQTAQQMSPKSGGGGMAGAMGGWVASGIERTFGSPWVLGGKSGGDGGGGNSGSVTGSEVSGAKSALSTPTSSGNGNGDSGGGGGGGGGVASRAFPSLNLPW